MTDEKSARWSDLRREINRCNSEILVLIREPRTAATRARIAELEESRDLFMRQIVSL